MGYKGPSFMDAGYFYAPYVPLTRTPTVFGMGFDLVYGASHKMIEEHAYYLWENAIEPKMDKTYYWLRAQEDMVSPIALALAYELRLNFVPGTTLYPYYYYTIDGKFVARARIGNNNPSELVFTVEVPIISNDSDDSDGDEAYYASELFDLNDPSSVELIIDFLRTFASIATLTKPLDDGVLIDPNSFNPNKGILTRYGKKLLQQGAQFYGKVRLGK